MANNQPQTGERSPRRLQQLVQRIILYFARRDIKIAISRIRSARNGVDLYNQIQSDALTRVAADLVMIKSNLR